MLNFIKSITLFFLFVSFSLNAQIDIKTYSEKIENGFAIYVDNNEFCPVSIKPNFKLKNLRSIKGNNKIVLLPAKTKKIKITELKKIKNGAYSFTWSYKYDHGDHFQKTYDKEFIYNLPYKKATTEKISQGYNGKITHQGKNALDFDMKEGTDILAARGGTVIKVIDINNKSCHSQKCQKYNNYITIYHKDGTFAEYTHIQKNGAKVKVGDKIKQGEIIAKSGDVGWADGPHLHFVVYLQQLEGKRLTLKTKFKTGNGDITEYLLEKKSYQRDY